jgi:hypothetical protein
VAGFAPREGGGWQGQKEHEGAGSGPPDEPHGPAKSHGSNPQWHGVTLFGLGASQAPQRGGGIRWVGGPSGLVT